MSEMMSDPIPLMQKLCPSCGVQFAMPTRLEETYRDTKASWYCPNGHPIWAVTTTKTLLDKANKQLTTTREELSAAKDRINELREESERLAERLKKLRKKVKK